MNWVELDNVGQQIVYTVSRQMMTENEDVDSTRSLSEEPLDDKNYRIGETNVWLNEYTNTHILNEYWTITMKPVSL